MLDRVVVEEVLRVGRRDCRPYSCFRRRAVAGGRSVSTTRDDPELASYLRVEELEP